MVSFISFYSGIYFNQNGSPDGKLEPLNKPSKYSGGPPRGGNVNPYHSGGGGFGSPQQNDGRTPFPPRTPMHSATPGWQAANSSRTPNPYDGARTPAWNASSRTPNPYGDGGRTPAWNVGSRTPNPYATGSNGGPLGTGAGSGWGGGGGGGATPARPGGWQTPARAVAPPPAAPSWGATAEAWATSPRAAPTPWDSSYVGCFRLPSIPFYLFSTFYHYRVLLPLLQQLPRESLLMLLLLRVAVKRQRTIQLLVVAALLLPVVQC
jgi:hypothetical protein